MKSLIYCLSLMGLSPFVLANPTREVIICKNDHYQLMVRDTAVVTYKSATLSFSGRTIQLQCQMELIEKSDLVNYSCMEDRAGDGRYLAGILMEKNTGTANISHEQIYPLKPKTLAEISCVLTEE